MKHFEAKEPNDLRHPPEDQISDHHADVSANFRQTVYGDFWIGCFPLGPPPKKKKSYACRCIVGRVSEPACFGAAPGILYPEPAPVPDKREHNFGFLKTDNVLSKIRSNTCSSTYRSYFMFTLEKTSNEE